MRFLKPLLLLCLTIIFIRVLDRPAGPLPAVGRLLDPIAGWGANAESAPHPDFRTPKGLHQAVRITMEDRMVPHIFAADDHDLYFMQGYIHAYFRLWQMDLQTRAAAGRVSEVIGKKAAKFDDEQRRKGMVYGAEQSLRVMEQSPQTKQMLDAYTEGVNELIGSLDYAALPLEYKLMDFRPEPWTSLKTALLMKYMADDLSGYTEDFPLTWLRDHLPAGELDHLFPEKLSGSKPIIPTDTKFDAPSLSQPPVPAGVSRAADSTAASNRTIPEDRSGIGSNNWAVSGSRTRSGSPILCNDPHLGLNLPSLWFEIQLHAPGIDVYGASLPGAPGVVLGFNRDISWGFTNNYRDVKDFYRLQPVDADHYLLDGKITAYAKRPERIAIKDSASYTDTVRYTVHGPVIYDPQHPSPTADRQTYALCWMGHRGTNELLAIYLMNRAKDYPSFVQGIGAFECPAQNMVYADRTGNIAMWTQGRYIDKWKSQGRFLLDGNRSDLRWGDTIPMRENPHALNPASGYVMSANQTITGPDYPYYYNGPFYELRAWMLDSILRTGTYDREAMKRVQCDSRSWLLMKAIPVIRARLDARDSAQLRSLDGQSQPDAYYNMTAHSKVAGFMQLWWSNLYRNIWSDEFGEMPVLLFPTLERTMRLISEEPESPYYDNRNTPQRESFGDQVRMSFRQTWDSMQRSRLQGEDWYKVRNTAILHLTKLPAFSYETVETSGWGNTINAVKNTSGPSWRMIVEMKPQGPEAEGIYPGGQSGNPGSRFYGDYIRLWASGSYHPLLLLKPDERPGGAMVWTINASAN